MKKTILALALLVAGMGMAKAQVVIPIDHIYTQVQFDSLRAQYPDRVAYLNELKQLTQTLETSKAQIAEAKKQLKDEKTHHKNATSFVKERTKELKTIEKSYTNEKKVQESYLKLLDKQHNAVMKETLIDRQTRDSYIADLNRRKEIMEKQAVNYQQKMNEINEEYEVLKNQQIDMAQYLLQLQNKELEIKQMETQLKNNQAALKAEIKATESIIKAQ